jgi:anti-sigma factor RsiW
MRESDEHLEMLLSACADGELDEEGRRKVDAALKSDPWRRERVEAFARLDQLLGGEDQPPAMPSPDEWQAVWQEVRRKRMEPPRERVGRPRVVRLTMAVAGLAAAAAFAVSLWTLRHPEQPTGLALPQKVDAEPAEVVAHDIRGRKARVYANDSENTWRALFLPQTATGE